MNKTVFNFRLKKINTTSAFMSSWWSGYFYHETDCWYNTEMADFRLKDTVEQDHGIKILIDWSDTVWQIIRSDGNNWDTMQKRQSDYLNNERQWQKIYELNNLKGQRQQIAIPSAVHKLWFFVKFRSMIVYGCPNEAIVINTEYTVLIFMWWKLIKNQHSWPADEIAFSCHERLCSWHDLITGRIVTAEKFCFLDH